MVVRVGSCPVICSISKSGLEKAKLKSSHFKTEPACFVVAAFLDEEKSAVFCIFLQYDSRPD